MKYVVCAAMSYRLEVPEHIVFRRIPLQEAAAKYIKSSTLYFGDDVNPPKAAPRGGFQRFASQFFPQGREVELEWCPEHEAIFPSQHNCDDRPCNFCDAHQCLGRGTCDEHAEVCNCRPSYGGSYCEVSLAACPAGECSRR